MKKNSRIILFLFLITVFVISAGCAKKPSGQGSADTSVPITIINDTAASESSQNSGSSQSSKSSSNTAAPSSSGAFEGSDTAQITVDEYGEYSDKEHVALYLHTYGHLPSNYVTKKEAKIAGWDSGKSNLVTVLPGKSIGGDHFLNYEGNLPTAPGRQYYECDINFNPTGKTSGRVSRGPERIVFSNDGLIFYTDDHYETFEQLY